MLQALTMGVLPKRVTIFLDRTPVTRYNWHRVIELEHLTVAVTNDTIQETRCLQVFTWAF